MALVEGARARRDERPFLDAFLQEFGLSNQEGIALMCIAEALLRIPDDATADRLIAEKLATGDWSAHAGKSESLFVNASTWGLMLTGGILDLDPSIKTDAAGWMRTLTRKAGEPVVRLAVRRAMRIIGGEFVVGRSDRRGAGAQRARSGRRGYARSTCSAKARERSRMRSVISPRTSTRSTPSARAATGRPARETSAISVKLSALQPRYYAAAARPRAAALGAARRRRCRSRAADLGIQLTIDAEEADRLDLSLDVIEALAKRPGHASLAGSRPRRAGLRQARAGRDRLGRRDCARVAAGA